MKKGFTLVELLAVLTIMMVIIGIAIPTLGGLIENNKIRYYEGLETVFKDAGKSYFKDHNIVKGATDQSVSLGVLITGDYIRPLYTVDKKECYDYSEVILKTDGTIKVNLQCNGYNSPNL